MGERAHCTSLPRARLGDNSSQRKETIKSSRIRIHGNLRLRNGLPSFQRPGGFARYTSPRGLLADQSLPRGECYTWKGVL